MTNEIYRKNHDQPVRLHQLNLAQRPGISKTVKSQQAVSLKPNIANL